jgi:hypothetical protein
MTLRSLGNHVGKTLELACVWIWKVLIGRRLVALVTQQ